jgi:hypothetical protein
MKSRIKLQKNQSFRGNYGPYLRNSRPRTFCKKHINSGIQLGAIRDKIEEIRSLKVNQR